MAWQVDTGPVHVDPEGVALKPQMKLGYKDQHCLVEVGLDDVRDGVSGSAVGQLRRIYEAEGDSFTQVLSALKAESEIAVLDDLARVAPQLVAQAMQMCDVEVLPEDSHVHVRVIASLGLGASAGVCLGWADTSGFQMIGVKGAVSAAVAFGLDIMAGLHTSHRLFKVIFGLANVCVEAVFELGDDSVEQLNEALDRSDIARLARQQPGEKRGSLDQATVMHQTRAGGSESMQGETDPRAVDGMSMMLHACCPSWFRYF